MQSIICMEHKNTQNIIKKSSKKSHKIVNGRRIFENTVYKNNDTFNYNPKDPNQAIIDIDEKLKRFQKKMGLIPFTDQHEFRTILYDKDIPQHCLAMLNILIAPNDTHKDKFSLFLAEKHFYYYLPPSNPEFLFSSPPQYSVNADSLFMKKLSLKAQEAWCLYVVTIAMHRKANFTHEAILLDETNKELFVALAAKNEHYIDLFNTLVKEARDIPLDLYEQVRIIHKIYAEHAWLQSYAF